MQTKYERDAYQFLSVYRFLSYALAIMFVQVTPPLGVPRIPDLQLYVILGALGVYSLLKVFVPFRWREGSPMTYVLLVGDFLLCISLVISTNGLDSVFLLYSLTPVMTSALLFTEKVALSLAAGASLSLSITHLVLSQMSDRFAWIMQGHNLTLLIIYTLFCFVIASLTFRTNLNVRRRIERDAILDEHRRIRAEIHDGVAQSLGYLNIQAKLVGDSISAKNTEQALSGLNEIREVVQDTYDNVREAIDQLSIEARHLPLTSALADYSREFREKTGIQVQVVAPKVFPRLSPVAELQLMRIAQEALTNVRRHAAATKVRVELENTVESVGMMVEDNGQGFTPSDSEKSPPGYHGLNIVRERAEGLGGTVVISSAPGRGTKVRITVPIEKVRL